MTSTLLIRLTVWTGLIAVLLGEVIADDQPAVSATTGAVKGTIRYEADAERPWRLGRYYVRGGKSGPLAEAVVALVKKDLRGPEQAREPASFTVDQKDFQFTPETVAIRAGDQVQYLNSDPQVHNVQAFHLRHSFNVNMPPKGKHVETFPSAVSIRRPYRLGCVFHSSMRAWIFVFDHPWFHIHQLVALLFSTDRHVIPGHVAAHITAVA